MASVLEQETGLVKYDAMCKAIAACERVDEAKEIRDQAKALEKYMHEVGNIEAEQAVARIRLRAERKAGQIMKAMAEKGQRARKGGDGSNQHKQKSSPVTLAPTLSDLGISKRQSSQFQQLADIPEKEFLKAISEPGEVPSTQRVIDRVKKQSAPEMPPPPDGRVLWLWGHIKDFERDGFLNHNPLDVLLVADPVMMKDLRRIVPSVLVWLGKFVEEDRKCQNQKP
jgi:hypothetical protein